MTGAGAPPLVVDWDDLGTALAHFSAVTALAVSAYDRDGQRRLGPFVSSKVAQLLLAGGVLDAGHSGHQAEAELAAECMAAAAPCRRETAADLVLLALPVAAVGQVGGAIVYGWAFERFPSSLGCRQIGQRLGLDGVALWSQARLESPVPPQRMALLTELLRDRVASSLRHSLALAELQRLSQLRQTFLAGVSHELRTPLQVMSVMLEVLLRKPLDDAAEVRQALLKIKPQIQSQARLIDDLLDAARTTSGALEMQRRHTPLAPILEQAVATVRPHADAKQMTLRVTLDTGAAAMHVLADGHRLKQVIWNLLSNAVKFAPTGGTVALSATADAGGCVIVVHDNGPGIDPSVRDSLFQPFTRQRRGNEQGLGLGLAIAREIVAAHDGTIELVADPPGGGTAFSVRLPAAA